MEAISSKINSQNEKYDQMFKHNSSSIHNVEVQLGQLASEFATIAQGHLSSNTEVNQSERASQGHYLEKW